MPANFRFFVLALLMTMLFFIIAMSPVQFFGCRNRGLLALLISLCTVVAALYSSIKAHSRKNTAKEKYLWILTSLTFAIPSIALFILA